MENLIKYFDLLKEWDEEDEQDEEYSMLVSQLQSIKNQMSDLLDEASDILRECEHNPENRMAVNRAKSYWFAHIKMALDNEHDYLGSGSVTMQDTINELGGEDEG